MELRLVQWSDEYKQALKTADRIVRRARQDRQFERNMMIKQKLHGIVVCLVSIIAAWDLSEHYGQTEYFILAGLFVAYGIYLICTKQNFEKQLRK
jgi:hypothetical protein